MSAKTIPVAAAPAGSEPPLAVLKFGSSVLRSEKELSEAVHEIYRYWRGGHRVIAVVSALGRTTDELLARARSVSETPDSEGLAALLATGEASSSALLFLALDRAGVPAILLDPARIGLRAEGPALDAEPSGLESALLLRALEKRSTVVVPGFYGQSPEGGICLLGRGGSDLTALFLSQRLGAGTCRLLKNVDGVYEADPTGPTARARYEDLAYADALRLEGRVVQWKALRYAQSHNLSFEVAAPGSERGTRVGAGPSRLSIARDAAAPGPLRVSLLGLGSVGLGVYHHLAARPDRFEVVGIAVKRPDRHAADRVAPDLLRSDPNEVLGIPSDIVVEVMGGLEPAATLVSFALASGRDVVTANKELVASEWEWLHARAAKNGCRLLVSAAVGGGAPILETVARLAQGGRILSFEGVLNGTANYVLDRMAEGAGLSEAVADAQRRGFAESDPSDDLGGADAARKLAILARLAFGARLDPTAVPRRGIEGLEPARVREARSSGSLYRQVAFCSGDPSGLVAGVRLAALPLDDRLARCRGEENGLRIERADGQTTFVAGKGAGRWPTSESVLADVYDLWRERR
jgi:homoserine dehydrogenase